MTKVSIIITFILMMGALSLSADESGRCFARIRCESNNDEVVFSTSTWAPSYMHACKLALNTNCKPELRSGKIAGRYSTTDDCHCYAEFKNSSTQRTYQGRKTFRCTYKLINTDDLSVIDKFVESHRGSSGETSSSLNMQTACNKAYRQCSIRLQGNNTKCIKE